MIRTRLAVAFALLATLALLQFLFAWWAAASAAQHAERSVVATRMLAEYLELAGDKQRLKVWFAQKMIAGDADPATRDRLTDAMRASIQQLRDFSRRMPPEDRPLEAGEIETIARNIATLERAMGQVERPGRSLPAAEEWRTVLVAFDEFAGRDMRELLREAVARHEAASVRESALLAEALGRIRVVNALLALAVLALAIVAVAYFIRRLDRPFARLASAAEALAAGDFKARSGVVGNDEFSRVGGLMDTMAERLAEAQGRSIALQRQLDDLVAERTRALTQAYQSLLAIESRRSQFFAELSHELRTPVTVIRGEADLALRNPGDATDQAATLRRIAEAASGLGARVQDLLNAARGGSLDYALTLRRHALRDVVAAAVGQMQAVATHRGVILDFGDPPASRIRSMDVVVDRDRLQQALVVVLDNAIRYSPAGGRVRVGIEAEHEDWVVRVEDEGPGMAADELERAFEPHYRGATGAALDPQGMGIGLAIARRLIEAQRGGIELERRIPCGLRASIVVPMAEPPAPDAAIRSGGVE